MKDLDEDATPTVLKVVLLKPFCKTESRELALLSRGRYLAPRPPWLAGLVLVVNQKRSTRWGYTTTRTLNDPPTHGKTTTKGDDAEKSGRIWCGNDMRWWCRTTRRGWSGGAAAVPSMASLHRRGRGCNDGGEEDAGAGRR